MRPWRGPNGSLKTRLAFSSPLPKMRTPIMRFRTHFTDPPDPIRPWYRWSMLVTGLAFLWMGVRLQGELDPSDPVGRYYFTAFGLTLILGVVAWDFRWPRPVTAVLRGLHWAWIVFALAYLGCDLLTRVNPP